MAETPEQYEDARAILALLESIKRKFGVSVDDVEDAREIADDESGMSRESLLSRLGIIGEIRAEVQRRGREWNGAGNGNGKSNGNGAA